jgi:hypothetical protein
MKTGWIGMDGLIGISKGWKEGKEGKASGLVFF